MIYLVSQARSRGASRSTRSRRTSHAFRNVRGVGSRRTDERLAGRDRHEGRRVRAALGHHLRSQRERRGELDLPNPGCRSEEHTSELQSLAYLVCRLLLEKKKRTVGRSERVKVLLNYEAIHRLVDAAELIEDHTEDGHADVASEILHIGTFRK